MNKLGNIYVTTFEKYNIYKGLNLIEEDSLYFLTNSSDCQMVYKGLNKIAGSFVIEKNGYPSTPISGVIYYITGIGDNNESFVGIYDGSNWVSLIDGKQNKLQYYVENTSNKTSKTIVGDGGDFSQIMVATQGITLTNSHIEDGEMKLNVLSVDGGGAFVNNEKVLVESDGSLPFKVYKSYEDLVSNDGWYYLKINPEFTNYLYVVSNRVVWTTVNAETDAFKWGFVGYNGNLIIYNKSTLKSQLNCTLTNNALTMLNPTTNRNTIWSVLPNGAYDKRNNEYVFSLEVFSDGTYKYINRSSNGNVVSLWSERDGGSGLMAIKS